MLNSMKIVSEKDSGQKYGIVTKSTGPETRLLGLIPRPTAY